MTKLLFTFGLRRFPSQALSLPPFAIVSVGFLLAFVFRCCFRLFAESPSSLSLHEVLTCPFDHGSPPFNDLCRRAVPHCVAFAWLASSSSCGATASGWAQGQCRPLSGIDCPGVPDLAFGADIKLNKRLSFAELTMPDMCCPAF